MVLKQYCKYLIILGALITTACGSGKVQEKSSKFSAPVHKIVRKKKARIKLANTASKVENTSLYSNSLHQNWHYAVYLPAGYSKKLKQHLPVLYMLHGVYGKYDNMLQYGDSKAMLDQLMANTKKRMIVVYVDGFNSFYVNQQNGMQMETAIMKDLLPTIERKYQTGKAAIGGISMGGYGAARLALKYPQTFAYADLISPAVWPNLPATNPIRQNVSAFREGNNHWSDARYQQLFPIKYLNENSKDVQFFVETTATDTTVPVKDVDTFMKDLRAKQVSVKYVRDTGDNHGWIYWKKALPNAYKWALEN